MNQKNVTKVNPFKASVKKTDLGIITTLTSEHIVSVRKNIDCEGKTLIANTVYIRGGQLVYTLVDAEGNDESYMEDEYMILPTLFQDPWHRNYVSVVHIPSKEMEITLPIMDRNENAPLPKANRPFVGDFIGVTSNCSIFHDVDVWTPTKPDKMLAIEFQNGEIKKKHNIKVDFPRNNKIYISNNEIHLLARENESWLHRQVDEKGKLIRQREVFSDRLFHWQVIHLSFESDSYLIYQDDEKTYLEKIDVNGKCSSIELIHLGFAFYGVWKPVKIAENTVVMNFTSAHGNGWLTIREEKIIEFFSEKDVKGYKNWITDEVFEISDEDLILNGICKTGENAYSVTFYPSKANRDKIKQIIVLNRTID